MEQQERDLRVFLGILKKNRIILLLVPIAVAVSIVINLYLLKPSFQATATVMIQRDNQAANDYSSFLANRELIKTYSQIGKSNNFLEVIRSKSGIKLTNEELADKIKINAYGDTQLIYLQAVDSNPVKAARLANLATTLFIEEIQQITSLQNMKVAYRAIVPNAPIKPRIMLNVLATTVFSLLGVLGLILLRDFLDSTFKDAQEIEERLNLDVLAIIPVVKDPRTVIVRRSERGINDNDYVFQEGC